MIIVDIYVAVLQRSSVDYGNALGNTTISTFGLVLYLSVVL